MKIEIIEDCSPYYMRIVHENMEDIIEIGQRIAQANKQFFDEEASAKKVGHIRLPLADEYLIHTLSPFSLVKTKTRHTGMLSAKPNSYYVAHKDGLCNRFGINYYLEVNDDKCKTNWYDESVSQGYEVFNDGPFTRELKGFDPDKFTPAKTATFKQGECILINVDIYHDFDNRMSDSNRKLLSLRTINEGDVYYETARRALFGI
jgi:hypothetical protein